MAIHLDPDKCLNCSACLVHCPVAAVTTRFLGPRLTGPALERFRLLGFPDDPSLTYCANCKNCEIACPQDVPIASINMLARQMQAHVTPPGFRDWICAHSEVIARCTKYVPAAVKNWSVGQPFVRSILDMIGIAKDCPMPRFAGRAFRDHIQHIRQKSCTRSVVFFPGCYINYYDPSTGFDLVWLLQAAGYEVIVPKEFVCCGIPLISGGFEDDARKNSETNCAVLADYAKKGIPVLTGCPSCRLMLTREIGEFFPDLYTTYGRPVVRDAEEFLLRLISSRELDISGTRPSDISCVYHAPCHQRAQGEGLPGLELLTHLNIDVQYANAGCCGISGSYGFKKEKYAIGQAVGERLFRTVRESPARFVATECGTCRLQITGATQKPALHPLTILRAVLDGRAL